MSWDWSDEMRRARERYESSPGYRPDPPARSEERRAADAERRRLRKERDLALAELGRALEAALHVEVPAAMKTLLAEQIAQVVVEASADQRAWVIPDLVKAITRRERERRKEAERAARLASLTCPSCNRVFKGSRPGATYCSSACRQAAYRARQRA